MKKNTSLVNRFLPLGGLFIAKSRSSPIISSLSDRPPSYNVSLGPASGSDLTLTTSGCWRLMILTLSLRTEGADERLLLPRALVSEGTLAVDFGRLAVVDLEVCVLNLVLRIIEVQLSTAALFFCFS